MLLKNKIVKSAANLFMSRYSRHLLASLEKIDAVKSQEDTLKKLLHKAAATKFGKDHDFARLRSLKDYQSAIPLRGYDEFWGTYWKEAFPDISNITWPGKTPFFALTSGTASGTTKYIPLTREVLASNQRAALTLLGTYYHESKLKNLFTGHFFFLGGSTNLRDEGSGIMSGDLSGITSSTSPSYLTAFTFPGGELALINDWEEKLHKLVSGSKDMDITAISGVPSWVLLLFSELKKVTGKDKISEIWPNLSLVVNGGVKFDPYEETFRSEIGNEDVLFLETYPSSEAFIAFEDLRFNKLRLMLGHDIFYEFIPVEELNSNHPARHTLSNIQTGINYAIAVTTPAGLWSYVIGDTISFERIDPPLLRFTGRTQHYLSAFGEHLIVEEVEKAITYASGQTSSAVSDFCVGPVFPDKNTATGYHLFAIEFEKPPEKEGLFLDILDQRLKDLNEDYEAHRIKNISITPPSMIKLKKGAFAAWMKSRGKLGGQNKVPRLDNSGEMIRLIEKWMKEQDLIISH